MEKGAPNFSLVAESYGIKGIKLAKTETFEEDFLNALSFTGPVLIDVIVNEEENCYPMVAPGKSNSQMIGVFKRKINKALLRILSGTNLNSSMISFLVFVIAYVLLNVEFWNNGNGRIRM